MTSPYPLADECYAGQAAAASGAHDLLDAATGFVTDRVLADRARLRPAYLVAGAPVPDETTIDLPGYPGAPVRLGNHAHAQFQLDALSESLLLLAAAESVGRLATRGRRAVEVLVEAVRKRGDEPDAGIWELQDRRWAHSRLICAAGLRAAAAARGGEAGLEWQDRADLLVDSVDGDCGHPSGRWQRAPGDPRVDAALVLPGLRGAVPATDPRAIRSVAAVIDDLRVPLPTPRDAATPRPRDAATPTGSAATAPRRGRLPRQRPAPGHGPPGPRATACGPPATSSAPAAHPARASRRGRDRSQRRHRSRHRTRLWGARRHGGPAGPWRTGAGSRRGGNRGCRRPGPLTWVVQATAGLATRRAWLMPADTVVDVLHGASMAALAARSPQHRRLALVSAALATTFAVADLTERGGDDDRSTTSRRRDGQVHLDKRPGNGLRFRSEAAQRFRVA